MRKRDKRPKAQEVHQCVWFDVAEVFPTVEKFSIEVTRESGHGLGYDLPPRSMGGPRLPEYFNCSGPLCYGGGFSLRDALDKLITQKLTKLEGAASCIGHEGSPGGRKRYNYCNHFFNYTVSITHKA